MRNKSRKDEKVTVSSLAKARLLALRAGALDVSDPVAWCEGALGAKCWPKQADILNTCVRHKRVSVRSGHKTGKSRSAAMLAWWWVHRWKDGRVVMTASTNNQVRGILWREIKTLYRQSRIDLPMPAELPNIGVHFPDGRSIEGFATKDAEKMAGVSGANLLFIVDEASGVPETIWEAIEGNRAGGAHVVAFSNPTQPAGTFFDSFHTKKKFWHTIHVSSIEATTSGIPGLATKEWCDEKLEEWGTASPLYQVRVLGDFPDHSEDAVIPLWVVEAAKTREVDEVGDLRIGIDPARYGDDESVIAVVRGNVLIELVARSGLNVVQVAQWAKTVIARHQIKGEAKARVHVDTIGLGAGVADILRAEDDHDVRDIVFSETAIRDDEYNNVRSEAWFEMGNWLTESSIPGDDKLAMDLLGPKYSFDNRGRMKLERKEDVKKRLGRSPDRADAVALAVYDPQLPLVPALHTVQSLAVASYDEGRWAGSPERGY